MNKLIDGMTETAGKKGIEKTIDLLVERFINPKLDKFINAPQDIFILKDLFNEYLKEKYDKDQYINTIVFQNESKTIDELYIPLTIIQNGKRNKSMILDENMKNIFEMPNKLLIIDTAGTGKSTLVKFLSNFCVEKKWCIPFVIELRRIESNQSMEDYIINDIKISTKKIKEVDIFDVIRRGDFIFFLDGYDEILEENKKDITKKIRDFITSANQNSFVLTSREDDGLSEFSDFIKYHIQELSKEEAYELIKKYDNYGITSENLINEIEKDENYEALKEFLGNPLMVSLLYLTYQYKGVLQYKKSIFYRQVYDALYDRHDNTKGIGCIHEKKSKLDIEDFRKVLCAMGFISIKYGKIEFDKDELIRLINDSIKIFPEIKANAHNYRDDLLHAVPLFKEEGVNYKWAHKSFAEYFAAIFICQERKEYEAKVLNDILKSDNSQKYYNVLDFCYDIDYKSVLNELIYPILSEYVSYFDAIKNNQKIDLWEIDNFYRFINKIYFIKVDLKSRPKDRNIINDYIEAMKFLSENDIYSLSYFCYLSKSENLIMGVQKTPTYEFIKLMYQKNIDIFKDVSVRNYSVKFYKEIDTVGIYDIFQNKDGNSFIFKNYDAILSLIFHHNFDFNGKILDIDKCKKLISEIEIAQKTISDDFFSLS